MNFALLQNQNIVPGTRWIFRMDIDDIPHPFYVAQIKEFDTEIEARGFLQINDGVMVPGKPWALIFAGVIDKTRCPIMTNHEEETGEFLQQAAQWLLSRG